MDSSSVMKQQHSGIEQKHLVLLLSCVFLYAVCFMAQAPLLPYVISTLGADTSYYGMLMSTFSGLQLVGSLLSGPMVDFYGGKVLLMVSFVSSAVCYVMTATATSVWMLFVSRLATLMQHAVLAARTLVTAKSTATERAALLGYIGASYGLGFALGPAAGGWLSSVSLPATAWAAAAGSLLALVIVVFGLPADAPPKKKLAGDGDSKNSSTKFSVASIAAVIKCPGVPALLLVQAGTGLAQSVFQGTFSLVMQQQFGLSSKANGMVLSYVGCCIVFAQALVIKPVSQKIGETPAVRAGCALLAFSFIGMGLSKELWQLLAWLLPLAVAGVTVATINTARLTKAVPPTQAGTVMALDMSMGSGLRTVSPLIGTFLLQRYGWLTVCVSCSSVLLGVLSLQLLFGQQPVPRATAGKEADERKTQ